MEFKEFVKSVESTAKPIMEASGHAFQRLERLYKAAEHSPDIMPNPGALYAEIKRLCLQAEQIYTDGSSYAVEVYRFPFIVGEEGTFALGDMHVRNEPSNGNMVIAIIRPDDRGPTSQVVTIMFRRSDDLGKVSQPFTPYALGTDKAIRLNQFKKDAAGHASYKPSGTKDDFHISISGGMTTPLKKKKEPLPRILRGGI